jgi:hypothetical protein
MKLHSHALTDKQIERRTYKHKTNIHTVGVLLMWVVESVKNWTLTEKNTQTNIQLMFRYVGTCSRVSQELDRHNGWPRTHRQTDIHKDRQTFIQLMFCYVASRVIKRVGKWHWTRTHSQIDQQTNTQLFCYVGSRFSQELDIDTTADPARTDKSHRKLIGDSRINRNIQRIVYCMCCNWPSILLLSDYLPCHSSQLSPT